MIEFINVTKKYNHDVKALEDINIKINKGEFVFLVGPSGSGKSTMLNVLSGIDTPTSGKVMYYDRELSSLNSVALTNYRKENLGFIFQSYNLISNLTIYENVELGAHLSESPLNIDEILDIVGLESMKNKFPYQLSGGQMQRVAIARAVVKNPKVLFCDEPTGALDEKMGKQILTMIQDINKKYNTTVIIVTHNPSISYLANTVIKMNSGKVSEIHKNDKVMDVSEIRWA